MTAISGAAMRCKTMMDGSLRIEVEVEPQDAQQAFSLFGRPGAPMALAALAVGHAAAKEPEKPKGGIRAQWVAMRCNEPAFQDWLHDNFYDAWSRQAGKTAEEAAASVVRHVCRVDSRAELDNNKDAAERFDRLIRGPWSLYYGAAAA